MKHDELKKLVAYEMRHRDARVSTNDKVVLEIRDKIDTQDAMIELKGKVVEDKEKDAK